MKISLLKTMHRNASNIVSLWKKENPGKRYFCKPDYPFIPQVRAEPEYWRARGWVVTDTGRAVRRISQ